MEQTTKKINLLPVVPLRGKVAFPHTNISFEVGREMTLKAVQRALDNADKQVFICSQKVTEQDDINEKDLYTVGCVARIKQTAQLPAGVVRVLCEGLYRAKAREITVENGYFSAVAEEILPIHGDEVLEEAYFRTAKALVKDVLGIDGKLGKEVVAKMENLRSADEYVDGVVSAMRVKLEIKQQILEEARVIERLKIF